MQVIFLKYNLNHITAYLKTLTNFPIHLNEIKFPQHGILDPLVWTQPLFVVFLCSIPLYLLSAVVTVYIKYTFCCGFSSLLERPLTLYHFLILPNY